MSAPNGVTAVTLLNGSAQFCGASGCQTLKRRCEFIVARPGGAVTKPRGITRSTGLGVPASEAFPFLAGAARLPRGFLAGSSCAGLTQLGRNNGFGQPGDRAPRVRHSETRSATATGRPANKISRRGRPVMRATSVRARPA